jgi:hypothetical protein
LITGQRVIGWGDAETRLLTNHNNKMKRKDLSELTDQELLEEAKKLKSFSITNAFIIGFLLGIVFFSVIKSTFGLLMLIPLYLVYKMINDPKAKRSKALNELLKKRNIK